jgi:hypothetical protein
MRYFDAMSAALQNAACTFSRGGGFTKYAYPYHGNTSRFTPVHCRTGSFALDGCEHTKEFSGKADIYGLWRKYGTNIIDLQSSTGSKSLLPKVQSRGKDRIISYATITSPSDKPESEAKLVSMDEITRFCDAFIK